MIRVAFVVGEYPPEEQKLREQTALAFSSAEVEVGIVRVAARPPHKALARLDRDGLFL